MNSTYELQIENDLLKRQINILHQLLEDKEFSQLLKKAFQQKEDELRLPKFSHN